MQTKPTTLLSESASALANFGYLVEVFDRDMRAVKRRSGKLKPFDKAAHAALNDTAWQILEFPCDSPQIAFNKAMFVLARYSLMAWLSRDERALTVLMESFLEIQRYEPSAAVALHQVSRLKGGA